MLRIGYILLLALIISTGLAETASAQVPLRGIGNRIGQPAQRNAQTNQADTFSHRTGLEDSLTIRFRYLDTARLRFFDSSLIDFYGKIGNPWHFVHLGNNGNAARNLLFEPFMKAGWDHGFHAYDNYNFTVQQTRFYNSTRPYAELSYMLGGQQEQFIKLMHTQNINPNWNAAIEYKLINSPGYFQNQNTNHNSYRVTNWFQSKNRRYQNFLVIVGNKLQSGENGGIWTDKDYLNRENSPTYGERAVIPTNLGQNTEGNRNPFSTSIAVGTYNTNATYLFRQQYDIGQKDSLVVNDTTVIPLFYPRLRLEHTISYHTTKYRFRDNQADIVVYDSLFNITLPRAFDTVHLQDFWKVLENDFSVYQFPDAKNAQQFIKVGATLENIQGLFYKDQSFSTKFHNIKLHGEYRNRTRNQKWDIEANGEFYVNGNNAGDYSAYISLKRFIGKQRASLQIGGQNVNRSASYNFSKQSGFFLIPFSQSPIENFNKENVVNLFGAFEFPHIKLRLAGNYYVMSNYLYYTGFYKTDQQSELFNVMRISLEKQFTISRNFHWRTWVVVQKRLGNGPINLPFVTTRNQVGYDGSLGFKNLNTSFGLEFRYFSSYKAPTWSPFIGQYTYQDTATVSMNMPDIAAYLHFRIKSFTAYVRAENLNTLDISTGQWINNNVPTRTYPYPGLQIRLGIWWSFVN